MIIENKRTKRDVGTWDKFTVGDVLVGTQSGEVFIKNQSGGGTNLRTGVHYYPEAFSGEWERVKAKLVIE